MKIGVYNRYWSTLGGGERHIGSLIDEAFGDAEVDLISTSEFDVEKLRQQLSLTLGRVNYVIWPDLPDSGLSPWTSHYDLFVNSTYRSTLYSFARKSVYFVFFPQTVNGKRRTHCNRKKLVVEGAYPVEPDGLFWSYPTSTWRFKTLRSEFTIPLRQINPNLTDATKIEIEARNCTIEEVTLSEIRIKSIKPYLSKIRISAPSFQPGPADLRYLGLPIDMQLMRQTNGFSRKSIGLVSGSHEEFLNSYDLFLSNSNYTKLWIKKRWNVRSVKLTPKIAYPDFHSVLKEKCIISVGRFFTEKDGSHNKKQEVLIEAFKIMYRSRPENRSWRLLLVGSTLRNEPDIKYVDNLVAAASGYPIDFHLNIDRMELSKLYSKSSIFWQATGFNENSNHPERFEHFGITTCEAMSYGCIPIVYDAAGQKEIVRSKELGYRFRSIDELVEATNECVLRYEQNQLDGLISSVKSGIQKFHQFDLRSLKRIRRLVTEIDSNV